MTFYLSKLLLLLTCFLSVKPSEQDVMNSIGSFVLDCIPVVNKVKGVVEAVSGKDMVTGEKLSPISRGLKVLGLIPGIGEIKALGKAAKVGKAAKNMQKASKIANAGKRLIDMTKKATNIAKNSKVITNSQMLAAKVSIITLMKTNPTFLKMFLRSVALKNNKEFQKLMKMYGLFTGIIGSS